MSVTATIAFLAGLASFLSPCVLPLVPAYLSYMSGASVEDLMRPGGHAHALHRTGLKSLFFVLGFSAVFIAMGATASTIGHILTAKANLVMKAGGILIIIFGLHMLGIFKIPSLYSEKRFHLSLSDIGVLGAFLIGVTFALGWTPCIGPVLASILALAANSETVAQGVGLLGIYSLGLGLPFIAAGFATGAVLRRLQNFKRYFRAVELASGALMLAVGITIVTGSFQALTAQFTMLFMK